MRYKKLNYSRELLFITMVTLLALPFGLYLSSFHTVNPETLARTKLIQGRFNSIGCEGYTRRSNYRIKITVNDDGESIRYKNNKFPVRCREIPLEYIYLSMRVVDKTILSFQVNESTYLLLEEGLRQFNLGHRLFFTGILVFPLWFILRPIVKKAGYIRVE